MPKIAEKAKVLGGRADVVRYASGTSSGAFFYREWNRSTKSYRTRRIEEATTLSEAVELATDIAFALREEENSSEAELSKAILSDTRSATSKQRITSTKRKPRAQSIEVAINAYLFDERRKRDAGVITESTYRVKSNILQNHLVSFLKQEGVEQTNKITATTFDTYQIYCAKYTRQFQNKQASVINEFAKRYLLKNRLISADIMPDLMLCPRVEVRKTDRMANPAINPDDWRVILDYVRDKWRVEPIEDKAYPLKTPNWKRAWFFRNAFWHYILLSKNTGMSPEELLKLKWKNIEMRDEKRINSDGVEEEWLVTYIYTTRAKTQASREIPCNQGRELSRWMRFLKEQISENGLSHKITKDTYVFGNIFDSEMKPVNYQNYSKTWRKIVQNTLRDKLKGHKFSEHPYTLYSMRSTFIEDHLIKGTDIYLVARIAGHDVKTLMESYERMDIRQRSREITRIEFGKKKEQSDEISLLELEPEEDSQSTESTWQSIITNKRAKTHLRGPTTAERSSEALDSRK